jgi:hypothetical protein
MTRLHCSAILIYILFLVPGNINLPQVAVTQAKFQNVPFKGTHTTVTERLSGPPMLQLRITGTGHATHLGQGTFVALSTLNLTTPPPFTLGGTATFNAANGDSFYTSFSGTATPREDGTMSVVMTHEVTGGTGRFKDASGIFTGETIGSLTNPEGIITYDGYINY